MKHKMKKIIKIGLISIIAVIFIFIGGIYIYSLDYYHADESAQQIVNSDDRIKQEGNMWVFYPDQEKNTNTGFIFYPGGKVEATAYAPLLKKLSEKGIVCILIKMPLNLAVFDINAAQGIDKKFPNIQNWYIGGHSLGGAMASNYAVNNSDKFKGLILLGAYPVKSSDIPILEVYGSEDKVLNKGKLDNTKNVFELAGGNHAYYGNYGEQNGDGTATITRQEQQEQTVNVITQFIEESN